MGTAPVNATQSRRLADWLMDRKWVALLVVAIPTVLLGTMLPTVQVYSRFADLLPSGHDYIESYNRMKATFGGANVVTMALEVVADRTDIFSAGTLAKIRQVTNEVDLIEGVNHYQVASIAHPKIRRIRTTTGGLLKSEPVLPATIPTDPAALKQLREDIYNNDIVYGSYVATDGRAALVLAGFDEGRLNYADIHRRLQALKADVEADGTVRLLIAGEPMLKGWIHHHSRELPVLFGASALLLGTFLWLKFRSLAGVAVPLLGTGLSAVWGLGFVGWMGYNLDPLILVVPLLISARTASHCVQFVARYCDELRAGRAREDAVRESMGELMIPAAIAVFADAAGLLVLSLSALPVIAKLGFFCAVWAASNLVTVMILVPLVLSVLPAPKVPRGEARAAPVRRTTFVAGWLAGRAGAAAVLGASAVAGVGAAYYGWNPPVGDSHPGSSILFADSEYNRAADRIAQRFAGANQFSIYFEGDAPHRMKDPDVVAAMEEFGRYMAETMNYGGTRQIPHLVRSINRLYHYDDPRWSIIPATQTDIGNTLFMYEAGAAMPGVMLEYTDLEGRTANFVVYYKDTTGETVGAAVAAAKRFLAANKIDGVTPRFAGGIIGTTAAANEEARSSDARTTVLIMALVLAAVSLAYRSLVPGVLVFLLIALAVMITRAFMNLRGIGLNANTLPVIAVGIGLGVDYAVYVLDRIRREARSHPLGEAIVAAMRGSGTAVVFTALMVVAAIFCWIPGSSLRFNSEMSLLLCVLLICNMVGAVTLVPALIRLLQPEFVTREHAGGQVVAPRVRGWLAGGQEGDLGVGGRC